MHTEMNLLDDRTILNDLVRETFESLLQVTLTLGWLWLVGEVLRGGDALGPAYVSLALLVVTTAVGFHFAGSHLHVAVAVYIGILLATATIIVYAFADASSFYFYLVVVLVSGMLAGPRTLLLVVSASLGLISAIGLQRSTPILHLLMPIVVIVLTALMAWISSRRLFIALAWALTMTRESQKNLQEARERRAEVLRILKSLDEAYVRLEWTNEALIFARETAQRAYRFKAEFVANVSHELRTPLNLIVGFSEMMATAPESYRGAALPNEYRGDVVAIYRSARHLSDLINDVLDLSKIESGRLPLSRELASLSEIVNDAVEMVRGLAESKGLVLTVHSPNEPLLLYLDRTRIRQVLLNLLTNAVRFTDSGGIAVRIRVSDAVVAVTVDDTGCGISPERLSQAFETFSQLHDDRGRDGNGLGLALSKKFIELHGGTMGIESTPGVGTVVRFTLPVEYADIVVPTRDGAGAVALAHEQPHVVVLHDDTRLLPLLQRYAEGYRFLPARTVDDAVVLVRDTEPAAVISDLDWMEEHGAPSTVAELRQRIPLLLCQLPSVRRFVQFLGVTDYLVKPISRADLLAALHRLGRSPRSVLVVDDDPHFIRLLVRILSTSNAFLQIFEASSVPEALEIVGTRRPDLVFLDLVMPDTSGYEFLDALHRVHAYAPDVIVMSARDLEELVPPATGELHLSYPSVFSFSRLSRGIATLLDLVTEAQQGDGRESTVDQPAAPVW